MNIKTKFAFDLLSQDEESYHDSISRVTRKVMNEFTIDREEAEEIVAEAYEKWVNIYYTE